MSIRLEKNGMVKEVKSGFSWTMLFFGFWVPVLRGDLKWAFIMFLAACCTFSISALVFPFIYNKIYIKGLIENGWRPLGEDDKALLIGKNIIGR